MKKNTTTATGRKQYTKPRLRTIELATDEVLAGSCKTASGPGPNGGVCTVGAPSVLCVSIGS